MKEFELHVMAQNLSNDKSSYDLARELIEIKEYLKNNESCIVHRFGEELADFFRYEFEGEYTPESVDNHIDDFVFNHIKKLK